MNDNTKTQLLKESICLIDSMSQHQTDGKWLEDLTAEIGREISDWDLNSCSLWGKWKDREKHFPGISKADIGIDVIGVRKDGNHVAIQCKSRKLDDSGHGGEITKQEIDSFTSTASSPFWGELWIVTNGDNPMGHNAQKVQAMAAKKVKMVNIGRDLSQEYEACNQQLHRDESKSTMQDEAVKSCVETLREHYESDTGGCPQGQARGRLILPCGTGKTRISLRIVESLTEEGQLSVVLCPSIALVAQIRAEYLQFRSKEINALAVCSDQTAGVTPRQEGRTPSNDPTLDTSFVSANEIKGNVTTDPQDIANWISNGRNKHWINVIFGTYQSGSKVAEALQQAGAVIEVLIADEAHRTAGIKRVRSPKVNERIRNFTLCHDQDAFPAKYRVYQTATPRVYTVDATRKARADWAVRTMDDETIFGVELYRRSYINAVENRWLCDYRIIAIGINDPEAFEQANRLASMARAENVESLKTAHYLRGLAFALAMAGATRRSDENHLPVEIGSCIGFMNTIEKSKTMVKSLQTEEVRDWIAEWFTSNDVKQKPATYALQHLDASSNVTSRQEALRRLRNGRPDTPQGILNVGIFGEGTDAPALNAVAFLEPRKSPIDVIQAVGRAMRTSPGKNTGYIICPVLIPPNVDPEQWLSTSRMEEGWQELGQILLALRAHDGRIETELENLIDFYIPSEPTHTRTFVAIAANDGIQYYEHEGMNSSIYNTVERIARGEITPRQARFVRVENRSKRQWKLSEPSMIVTGKVLSDNQVEMRTDTIQRSKGKRDDLGPVDLNKCRARAKEMINKPRRGRLVPNDPTKPKPRPEPLGQKFLRLTDAIENTKAIKLNLLDRSGLKRNRVERDLNILAEAIEMAAIHLKEDDLEPVLRKFFSMSDLAEGQSRANGCTVAALIMMNAAMLHQRIDAVGNFINTKGLATAKNATDVIRHMRRDWDTIMRQDYKPVFEPAIDILNAIEDETARKGGLERALRHIASEAERIAATYADMGMDHAGPLFNRVMGDQRSDGAFFTRPLAAVIAANLALDACDDVNWTGEDVWKTNKVVDLACGSGTLLAAVLTEMRRRAAKGGADKQTISKLHRIGVEHALKGFDINSVSLQLAAAQLTIGNAEVRFNNMGLHRMPYGPNVNGSGVSAGTLELLAQREVVDWHGDTMPDLHIESEAVWTDASTTPVIETAVDSVRDARIVIMNPPFTNRAAMGEKYADKLVQKALRDRVDVLEERLVKVDPDMTDFWDKNSIRPLFVALADHCLRDDGVLSMVIPTAALCAPSGASERRLLANRYHIHTIVTCHMPGQINMSQGTNINESIVIARRHIDEIKPDTRFVHLDRFPMDENEAEELCDLLRTSSDLSNGWGVISRWPADRMTEGDWSPAIWRDPVLASAAWEFANDPQLIPLKDFPDVRVHATGRMLRGGGFEPAEPGTPGSFPIIKSKGAEGQRFIKSEPDQHLMLKTEGKSYKDVLGETHPKLNNVLKKAGNLLITAGQDLSTARVTAVAGGQKYVGNGWIPVTGLSAMESKALAVFINSSIGRMLLMRSRGKKLAFPSYSAEENSNLKVPDIHNKKAVCDALSECYEQSCDISVPQFRDGECEIRTQWDYAVAKAMNWSITAIEEYRKRLDREPCVRGLGYNQHAEASYRDISEEEL